ncbi:MAG: YegS/Rv2252/BmrU family lipid kinase [Verrucomicrobiota bacterium]
MSTAGSDPERICIIFNPTAKGEGAKRLKSRLHGLDRACALKPTFAAGTARPLAAEAVREGFGTIVAMGGDGTIHEVVNGMADEPDGFIRSRLGVLPVGTVNVFARELGVPFHFQRAWQVICRGKEIRIDLPAMRFATKAGRELRRFVQMAGAGLDARAVELMDWELKKRVGQLAYVASGFRALGEKAKPLRVTNQGREYSGPLVLIGNGRLYGGPIPLFHRADLRDGLLDICVFPRVNWFVILRYACAYLWPRLLLRGGEMHFQAASVAIEGDVATPVELDGEHVGYVPATCDVARQAMRVVVP